MTKSFEIFISQYHKDILVPLSFGHIELMTDEIWEEYVNWCETDETKPYLNETVEVEE
jgi:hypothetical protein